MRRLQPTSRRHFLQASSVAVLGATSANTWLPRALAAGVNPRPLQEFHYSDVVLTCDLHENQLKETHDVLMGLSDDSLLKPFREMAGMPAPGKELGGWYLYDPLFDQRHEDAGFAPGSTFGQWVSALARYYAITGSEETRNKVLRLNRLYAKTISGDFYVKNRFPAYCYDKLVCGLIDSHTFAQDPDAFSILDQTTATAIPHLPGHAVEREHVWRPGKGESYTWDESYTMPENLFLAYQRGAGEKYRTLAMQYLDDKAYFDPLAAGENVLGGRHAYSYVNALSSAMQAYITVGSEKHLRAAKNAFEMLIAQSFATGGWGPDEQLRAPGSGDVNLSLTKTHNSFETPCGSYAHFKLTRYLLRVTRDSTYGDSMERVMYNTVLGAKSLQSDGRAFYYSDYNFQGRKVYSDHIWPCCSGTLPQVVVDYRINTYLRDPHGVYVNLYIPSKLKWQQDGAEVILTQTNNYPFEGKLLFEFAASRPASFMLHLRVPDWAAGTSAYVNGNRAQSQIIPGNFLTLDRHWKTGDRVELDMPMSMRLEAISPKDPRTVALLYGPLVLFPIGSTIPTVTREQLLTAKKVQQQRWQIETGNNPLTLLPFTAIDHEPYSTYLKLS